MDTFVALLCTLPALLGFIALFVMFHTMSGVSALRRRVARLELEVDELRAQRLLALPDASTTVPEPAPAPTDAPQERMEGPDSVTDDPSSTVDLPVEPAALPEPEPELEPELADLAPVPPRRPPLSPERIAVYLGAGLGGMALLVGAILGLAAVAQSGWFGPAARISFALITGTALWVGGALLRGRMVAVPSALSGVGMGVLYGSFFAGHALYDLFGTTTTFLALVAISAVAGLRATAMDDRFMAYLGLFGGLLAPVAVSTGQNGAVGLFVFLTMLSLGTLGSASRRRWPDLVVACLVGSAALFTGWSATWLAPDSVRVALLGAFALSIPYALVAARTPGDSPMDQATRLTGAIGSMAWMLLVTPWLLPLDSAFTDPRTYLTVTQATGSTRLFGAIALGLLAVPAWLAARSRGSLLHSGIASLLVTGLTLAWTGGWSSTLDQGDALAVLGPLLPMVVGLAVHLGSRTTGTGLALLPFGWLAAWSAGVWAGADSALLGASFVAMTLLAVIGTRTSATAPLLSTFLGAGAIALAGAAASPTIDPWWTGAELLLLLGLLPLASLGNRWTSDPYPALGLLPGALASLAVFPAAYLLWERLFGTSVIGLLPLLLGLHALLCAALMVRRHRLRLDHPLVVTALVVVLAGVTFALPIQVQERWLTVGWALEAAALAWIGRAGVRHPLVRWTSLLLAFVVAVRLVVNPFALAYGTADGWPILNWTLYTWGLPTVAVLVAAKGLEATAPENDPLSGAGAFLRLLAMAMGFALINVQVSHAFQDTGPVELGGTTMLQGMVRSLAWSGYGLGLLVVGLISGSRSTRFVGFAFLLLAAAKVSVYDLWTMPGFVRVGSLVGLGLTLIIAAALFNRLVLREPAATGET